MRLLADEETLSQIMTTLCQFNSFLHEEERIEHYAIADNVYLASLENSRRNRAEHILLAIEFQCVTSVRTTLESCYDVITWSQYIDYLTFTLVSPLEAEQNIYFHVSLYVLVSFCLLLCRFCRICLF